MKKALASAVLVLTIALLWSTAGPALGDDEVTDLAEKARKAYAAGDYQEALNLYQQIVQHIQAMVSASLERFMPQAPAGWEAAEIESQSWTGSTDETSQRMTNLTREYTRESDEAECTVVIANWPQMIQGYRQTIQMFEQMGDMMNADPDTKVTKTTKDGWDILKIVEVSDGAVQLSAVHDQIIVHIELDRNEPGVADTFLNSIDLPGLLAAVE
ncbi:MAG: hypothetical protein JSW50_05760 [Candidatus Latescibacterota bacterium]|nr:MAG: hypothetical protein JSW50_05760 [Candidatus Latescibacterota bacterium]